MRLKTTILSGVFAAAGLAAVLAASASLAGHARRADFLNLYAAGSLALEGRSGDLYKLPALLERERALAPGLEAARPFSRPPFYAAFLAPLALLPYRAAFWCWVGIQCSVLAGCWIFAARRWGVPALLVSFLFPPVVLGIAHGQDGVLVLALVVCALALAGKHPFSAGAVLGLALFKFHLLCLWPLSLAAARRWKMLAGLAAAAAVEFGVSLALAGAGGLRDYAALLRRTDLEGFLPTPFKQLSLWGPAAALGIPAPAAFGLALAVGIVCLAAVRRAPTDTLFRISVTASLAIAPHVYGYDAAVLLLPIWLALEESAPLRYAAVLLGSPLVFLLLLAGPAMSAVPALALLAFLALLLAEAAPKKLELAGRFELPTL